ncbi:mannitol dehydrogenase family protein [Glycomyces niveus]|uniref:Mannitol-1-phosphate 5-dehydrogenase n=1 Tax=Glycomyces niveus TaxID=2820287 RepID=A0ABS3U4C3_9ACTN|nr:mannitol dehydrogenase family protein [Glycomyces sp. NEAU-S30]MBO3733619.1 mannitol dehydrogenase family protein [Glycomyces sp. NEAU-S30]
MERLTSSVLKRLPGDVQVPGDRPQTAGVLHLGAGAFHRAHQAVYTDDTDWGITVAAPNSRGVIDALAEQDGLFSVATLGPEGASMRVVGAIADTVHIASERERAVDLVAAETTHVVTLTVTEKAYRDPAGVPGLLAAGLAMRAARGGPPLTILCCDNLPDNGKTTRAAVEPLLDDATRDWAEGNVAFPSSMVDRIVPASTQATYERALADLGVTDLAAVEAEPFTQWVIEDDFAGPRPPWDATYTHDVAGWERLKLRTLNGVHSTLAYLGALADVETISETLALPGAESFARWLIAEQIAPSLTPPDGQDTVAYGEGVLERFHNPGIRHRCLQIAMDGSQKLPQRLFATIADLAEAHVDLDLIALPVAAWTRFCAGRSDDGAELPLDDPLKDVIRQSLAAAGGNPAARIDAILGLHQIVPPTVAENHQLRRAAAKWLRELDRHGVATTLEHL